MDSASERTGVPTVKRTRPLTRTDGPAQNGSEPRSGRSQYPARPTLAPVESAVLPSRKTDFRNEGTGVLLSVVVDTRSRCQPQAHVGGIA